MTLKPLIQFIVYWNTCFTFWKCIIHWLYSLSCQLFPVLNGGLTCSPTHVLLVFFSTWFMWSIGVFFIWLLHNNMVCYADFLYLIVDDSMSSVRNTLLKWVPSFHGSCTVFYWQVRIKKSCARSISGPETLQYSKSKLISVEKNKEKKTSYILVVAYFWPRNTLKLMSPDKLVLEFIDVLTKLMVRWVF